MTPFDMLFFALICALVLVIGAELWHMRRRPPPPDDREPWIQLWPPDDKC
jgi:hypothetical protein